MATVQVDPVLYFPAKDGEAPQRVPTVLTEADLIRLLRLDEDGGEKPDRTLARYRHKGLLRAVQIGRFYRYRVQDVAMFLDRIGIGSE